MRPALVPVLLAVVAMPLVAAAAPGGPAVSETRAMDPVSVSDETPRMLTVGTVAAEGYNGTTLDWSAAFGSDAASLRGTFAGYHLEERVSSTDDEEARQRAFDEAADRVAARLASLRDREENAVQAYASGALAEREMLARLGRVHDGASALRPVIQSLLTLAADGGSTERAYELVRKADTLTGPLRADLAAGVSGAPDPATVHVEASADGVTLARVLEESPGPTYVRETVRFDNRDGNDTTTFENQTVFYNAMAERYPWAMGNSNELSVDFPGAVHQFYIDYGTGTFTAYVDGSTRRVFRDVHRQRASQVPVTATANATGSRLSVQVNATYDGGPLQVAVENAIGTTIDATVTVGNRSVGSTGDDGVLWTVAPNGRANVTATTGDDSVSVPLPA